MRGNGAQAMLLDANSEKRRLSKRANLQAKKQAFAVDLRIQKNKK